MKKFLIHLAVLSALSVTSVAGYSRENPVTVEGFDFNYTSETHSGFNLVQVFDDGDMTYFQFADAENFPSVQVVREDGTKESVPLESKTPYLVVRTVANKFALQMDKKTIFVRYNGKRQLAKLAPKADPAPASATAPVANTQVAGKKKNSPQAEKAKGTESGVTVTKTVSPASAPVASTEAPATEKTKKSGELITAMKINVPFFEESLTVSKKSREDIEEKVRQLRHTHRAIIKARPSNENNMSIAHARAYAIEGILRNAGMTEDDIKRDVVPEPIKGKTPGFYISEIILIADKDKEASATQPQLVKTAPLVVKANTKLTLKKGDSLSDKLTEWATRQGYTIVWEAADYRAGADIEIDDQFETTVQQVVNAMKVSGVNLDPTLFDNKLVRIVEVK